MRRLTTFGALSAALAAACMGWSPLPALGQSLSGGALSGNVFDVGGSPVFDADVTLENVVSGMIRAATSDRNGRFRFSFLTPGDYTLRVEAVGYRPVRVVDVPIGVGVTSPVTLRLTEEPPPVTQVDTIRLTGSAADRVKVGIGRWIGGFGLSGLPEDDRRGTSLSSLLSEFSADGGADGLPGAYTGIYLDGLGYRPAKVPGATFDPLAGILIPRGFLSGVEVTRPQAENELGGSAGAIVSAVTKSGGPEPSLQAFADYTGGSLWSSQSVTGDTPENQNFRGGFVASVPIVPDSVHAIVGLETWRIQRPRAPLTGATSALGGLAGPGGLDLPALEAVTLQEWSAIAGFGRVDWQMGEESISIHAHAASVPESDALPDGYPVLPTDPASVFGRDIAVGANVQTPFTRRSQLEVKAGMLSSTRTFRSSPGQGGFPQTNLASWPLAIGTDAALPGTAKVTQFDLSPVVHFEYGPHELKGGASLSYAQHEIDQSEATLGRFAGSDDTAVLFGQGFFDRTENSSLASSFALPTYSFFAQDMWSAAPGLQVVFGARVEIDQLPEADLLRPMVWDSLTVGPVVQPDSVSDIQSFSTRFAFTWDVGESNTTFLRGSAGLSYQSVDPYVIHQWMTGDGRRMVERDLDPGSWPAPPQATDVTAPTLTIDTEYRRPRSSRGSFGVTRSSPSGLALHASTSFRRTEHLLRQRDLNLTPQPSGVDQFGRPVFGELVKRGGTLGARPSYNRRFPTLDRVYALVTDGWSEYRDVSVILEKRGGPLQVMASYTFSRTEDNMPGWGGGGIDSRLVPQTQVATLDFWDEGISDFDVPHRLVAALDLELPALEGLRLSGIYRFQSGDAFTPGFRPGVDANGDGSGFNDPAYVGAIDLGAVGDWTCVRNQTSGPVARNTCRGEYVQSLDLRLSLGLDGLGVSNVELVIDALGVIEPEIGDRDRALYLVNPGSPLSRVGDTFNVPLAANPDFGEFARRLDPGRVLRVGLRIGR